MQQDRTLVSFDWAIKYLLRNKADYVVLEGFLTTLLGKKIKIKNLTDSESNKNSANQKYNHVDVLADYFHRMLFGSSKAIAEHLGKGMRYSKVRKVYSVNVVYFDLGSGKDYIYHGTTTFKGLHYKDELKLTDRQKEEFAKLEVKDIYPEYYLLRVNHFKNVVKNKIDEWMYFLKNSKVKPKFKAPGLAEAVEKLEYSRLSPKERRAYDKYLDVMRGNDSSIYTAKLEGKAEGKAEGRAEGEAIGEARGKTEGRNEVLNLMAKGYSLAQIKKKLRVKSKLRVEN